MIINHSFAQHHNLTLCTLRSPLNVRNVDGSLNRSGPIHFTTIQTLRISTHNNQYHQERSEFYVTSLATHDIILGTDWLKAHNPELNWTNSQITFSRCPTSCALTHKPLIVRSTNCTSPTIYISTLNPSSTVTLDSQYEQLATPYFLLQHQLLKYHEPQPVHLCTKTTHSTTFATKHSTIPAPDTIPQQFQKYHSVFNEQDSHRLPKHQPWDHAIDLKPNFTMKKCGVYRLTPAEHLALKDYIQEHLAKGYIHPSKSPITSLFFFVAKKGGSL